MLKDGRAGAADHDTCVRLEPAKLAGDKELFPNTHARVSCSSDWRMGFVN
jgi:hypothetical protein